MKKAMSRDTCAAEALLQNLGITEPRDIDIEAIAYSQGAIVQYRPLDGCEARIFGRGDRAMITVDSRKRRTRQRFSAAHELGHWHHHRGRALCKAGDIGNPRRDILHPERVADSYAADLLLPRFMFAPRADAFRIASYDAVNALADEFETSLTATAIRLADFGPEPAMLVCHGPTGRQWFHRPRNIPEHWFPRDDLDADSYAMDVLHGDEQHSRRVLIGADAWFDRRGADRFEIYEQSFKVGNGEILTLLVFKDDEMLEDET